MDAKLRELFEGRIDCVTTKWAVYGAPLRDGQLNAMIEDEILLSAKEQLNWNDSAIAELKDRLDNVFAKDTMASIENGNMLPLDNIIELVFAEVDNILKMQQAKTVV